jgi:hypothetical protein
LLPADDLRDLLAAFQRVIIQEKSIQIIGRQELRQLLDNGDKVIVGNLLKAVARA